MIDFSDGPATKAARRDKKRAQIKHDRTMRKEIRSEKPAFIRSMIEKEQSKREAATTHQIGKIRRKSRTSKQLAADVTCHIIKEHGGEIKGKSLPEIYKRLASELLPDVEDAVTHIEAAVTYGCHRLWLMQSESSDEDSRCCIPYLQFAA